MIDNAYKWYPIYTKSRAEKKAFQELQRKNITCYLPLRKELKQWSDRKKWVEEPLFKSYVFVYISSREYSEVLFTQGISRFVYFSGKIASMPQKQIDDLKLLLAGNDELEIIEHELEAGEKVLVNAGPFKGMIAELVSIKSKRSLVLKLEALGYAIQVNTSMAYIEPLK